MIGVTLPLVSQTRYGCLYLCYKSGISDINIHSDTKIPYYTGISSTCNTYVEQILFLYEFQRNGWKTFWEEAAWEVVWLPLALWTRTEKITFSAKGRQLYVNVLKGAAFLYDLFITQPLNKRVLRESKSLNYISYARKVQTLQLSCVWKDSTAKCWSVWGSTEPEHVFLCVFLSFIILLCYLLVCQSRHNSEWCLQIHVSRL